MSNRIHLKSISPKAARKLRQLRRRGKWLLVGEGVSWCLVWLVVVVWVVLALDYLPVRYGYSELNSAFRMAALAVIAGVLSLVFFRVTLRKILVRWPDQSLAVLIERSYRGFSDSLITTVGREGTPAGQAVDTAMLERTRLDAEALLDEVDASTIMRSEPMVTASWWAGAALTTWILFALLAPANAKLASLRIFTLSEQLWPRRCELVLSGLRVRRDNPVEGIDGLGQLLQPTNGVIRVARGASLTLDVNARFDPDNPAKGLPDSCWLNYRYLDGESARGSLRLKRVGSPRIGVQKYSLDGGPLESMMSGIEFDVSGGDARLGPYTLLVVNEPAVKTTELDIQYPAYLKRFDPIRYSDRVETWSGKAAFPVGTEVEVRGFATTSLERVYVRRPDGPLTVLEVSGDQFTFPLPRLQETAMLEFYLCDQHGIIAESPHVVTVEAVEDQPPQVESRLVGIGTAITPDVVIPLEGQMIDDYGVAQSWVDIRVDGAREEQLELPLTQDQQFRRSIDFRMLRSQDPERFQLPVGNESRLLLSVSGQDFFDLQSEPNIGQGNRFELEIVTPAELLRLLEQREVGQRQRLEQVARELGDVSVYLKRTVASRVDNQSDQVEPGDRDDPSSQRVQADDLTDSQGLELRRLFAKRTLLQVDKSVQEILGSAAAFENFRLQLINNRVSGTNREQRYQVQIIEPLRSIADETLSKLRETAGRLENDLGRIEMLQAAKRTGMERPTNGSQDQRTAEQLESNVANLQRQSLSLALEAEIQLREVLSLLVKYETQNELLDIVRKMIQQQKDLLERTRKERQKQAFEGLLDDLK